MTKVEDIIKALRCQGTAIPKCEREACPYWRRLSGEEVDAFCKSLGTSYVPEDFRNTCEAERCFSEAADLLERMRWISVAERLPGENTKVIVYETTDHSIRVDYYLSEGNFFSYGADVSHWMPLPEPPEV